MSKFVYVVICSFASINNLVDCLGFMDVRGYISIAWRFIIWIKDDNIIQLPEKFGNLKHWSEIKIRPGKTNQSELCKRVAKKGLRKLVKIELILLD